MGGKNSVFKKPLGSTGDKIKKAVEKIPVVGDISKTVDKAVDDVREVADKIDKEVGLQKVGSVYDANKAGIDGAVGLVGRAAAAYYTLGASELVGGGKTITKQFGKDNSFAQYGKYAGAVGGMAGAGALANGTSWVNSSASLGQYSGAIGQGLKYAPIAKNVIEGKQDVGRAVASVAVDQVGQNYGSDGNMEGNFWSDLGGSVTDIGVDWLKNEINGGKDRNVPVPVYAPPQQQAPINTSANNGVEKQTLILAGGAVIALVGVLVALRK